MKNIALILFFILLTTISFAQNTDIENIASQTEPVPFQLVEIPPLAPDCKSIWKVEKRRKCTQDFITNHVNRKFNTELVSELGLVGRIRIDLLFTIDKEGKPKNITATGGPEFMNQHAIEVIEKLPQLTPAMQNGKTVEVSYKLPILFDIV